MSLLLQTLLRPCLHLQATLPRCLRKQAPPRQSLGSLSANTTRCSIRSAWRIRDKAAAPETILEGSSVWNTEGSMPADYGSDISDVPMEDGEVPSAAVNSESAAEAHDTVTGSRRPREDDPSAPSSKRSRNDDEEKAPRCTCAATSLMTLRLQRNTLIR
ncbi:hypothetical protein PC121_g23294 [Phytophthora cactorum]|nr:hypothetical protein PC120_g24888 [Phytophthora cactorum]KAG3041729.1 hypothetical protein PC121_g23294 [Phytophthora cactorum]